MNYTCDHRRQRPCQKIGWGSYSRVQIIGTTTQDVRIVGWQYILLPIRSGDVGTIIAGYMNPGMRLCIVCVCLRACMPSVLLYVYTMQARIHV